MPKATTLKVSAIVIAFLLFIVSPAFALNLSATREGNEKRVETKQKKVENRITMMREKQASREASLQTKLQTFRDKKKATAAARINENLNRINARQTGQMQKHLDQMTILLNKLEDRVNQGKPDIKDPALAKEAVASARATIATASAAVSTQAEKDYTITVTSESRIKTDAKTQRDRLHNDLLTLRKAVIDAKQSVANAIRTAKSNPVPVGTESKKEGTTSEQQ